MPNNIVTPMDTRIAELQKVLDQHVLLIDQLTVAVRVLTEQVAELTTHLPTPDPVFGEARRP